MDWYKTNFLNLIIIIIMSLIKDLALKVGKFMHHHKQFYSVIRILVLLTTIATVGY